jgi:hypothetical protein
VKHFTSTEAGGLPDIALDRFDGRTASLFCPTDQMLFNGASAVS